MPNALYEKARQAFGNAQLDWLGGTIRAALVGAAYTPDLAADEYLADLGGALVGTPVTLSGKTNAGGVMDAADISFTGLVDAPDIPRVVIYQVGADAASSRLIGLVDTATGLPIAAGATQVNWAWSNGPNKIFKL